MTPHSAPRLSPLLLACLVIAPVGLALGCGKGDKAPAPNTMTAPSAGAATAAGPAQAPTQAVYLAPVGPELAIAPGRGISAIRFGSNVEALERHMGRPCEVRTETRCLYIEQAVDFTLKDGVVSGMKVFRKDRRVPGVANRVFGIFNGQLPPSIQFGLHRHIVAEEFKQKPERTEEVKNGPEGLAVREHYPGLVLEYDTLSNGNVVLSSFEVLPLTAEQKTALGIK